MMSSLDWAGLVPAIAAAVQGNSLAQRERAKAAELTAPGHAMTASGIKQRRQRYQRDGLVGLADGRSAKRMPAFGRVAPAVTEAMQQAIAETAEASSKTIGPDAEANRQLTNLDGWRKSIDGPPAPPALLPPGDLNRLSTTERDLYDEDRLDHHARMLVVATSFVEKTVVCGRRLVLLNRHAISARRGLMVSGLPGTGKTSAITHLAFIAIAAILICHRRLSRVAVPQLPR